MVQEQIFQLKITAAQLAAGDLDKAKLIYAWLAEEALFLDAQRRADFEAKQALLEQQRAGALAKVVLE